MLIAMLPALATAAGPAGQIADGARCIVPAKAGGGFDLTCQLARDLLQSLQPPPAAAPLALVYQPGGIGALALAATVRQRPADPKALVAFSSGSLLNLAQGRFGAYGVDDVRWLAVLAVDYGVVAVRHDSPHQSLGQLMAALRERPDSVVFGASGSIGSQDWMKAALLARAAGVSHKELRFVAFEGGGDAMAALAGNHVHVFAGDAAEVAREVDLGAKLRLLAVLSDRRLPGRWSSVPTATEQGYNIRWPILRGLYLGPGVSAADHAAWTATFDRALAQPGYAAALARVGLHPGAKSGTELDGLARTEVDRFRRLAAEFGLNPR